MTKNDKFGYVVSNSVSTTFSQPHHPKLNSYKSEFSWSEIPWEDKDAAVIDAASSPGNDEAAWPSVINAESVLASPVDSWYCYWSGHNSSGIALSTAPNPWGPWTYHDDVFTDPESSDHTPAPCAIVDPQRERINLYYHTQYASGNGIVQRNKLATSPLSGDGTSFNVHGAVLNPRKKGTWDDTHRSYLRVLRAGSAFVGVYVGRDADNNPKGIGVCHSFDGENFVKSQQNPAFDNTQTWPDYTPNAGKLWGCGLSFLGGDLNILYSDSADNAVYSLPYSMADKAPFQKGEEVYTPPAWCAGDLIIVQDFVADEDYVYMFYFRLAGSAGKSIGVARVSHEDII